MDFEITEEPIELYKILKFENLVNSGGEAKPNLSVWTVPNSMRMKLILMRCC